jgi:hypothetical protein
MMGHRRSGDWVPNLLRWIAIVCLFLLAAYLQAISHAL